MNNEKLTQYQRRRNAGLCVRCGNPAIQGKSVCNICAEKQRIASKERRNNLIANSCCIDCGVKIEPGSKRRCNLCQSKINKFSAEVRKERNKKGLCQNCGKPKERKGVLCEECAEKLSKTQRKHYQEAVLQGKCPKCGSNIGSHRDDELRWRTIAEKLAEYLACECERVDCEECSAFCPMPKSREIRKGDWIKEAKKELGYE